MTRLQASTRLVGTKKSASVRQADGLTNFNPIWPRQKISNLKNEFSSARLKHGVWNGPYLFPFSFSLPIRRRYLAQVLENLWAEVVLRCVWLCHAFIRFVVKYALLVRCVTLCLLCVTVDCGFLLFQILFQSSLRPDCVEEEESPGE